MTLLLHKVQIKIKVRFFRKMWKLSGGRGRVKLTVASVHWVKTNFVCVFASFGVGHLVSTLVVGAHIGNAAFLPYLIFFFFQKITEQSDDYGVRQDPQSFDFWHFPPTNLSLKRSRFSRRIKRLWVAWIGRNAHIRKVKFRRQAGAKKKMESTCFIVSTVQSWNISFIFM